MKFNYEKFTEQSNLVKDILFNKGLSLRLNSLLGDKSKIDLDLNIYLKNGIPLQRSFVWNLQQQRSLIISLLKEYYIPPITVIEYTSSDNTKNKLYKVIDGKQRLRTIQKFLNNEFSIIHNDIEYYFKDFDEKSQKFFNFRWLTIDTYYEDDEFLISDEQLVYLFWKLNYQGTEQDENHIKMLQKSLKQ